MMMIAPFVRSPRKAAQTLVWLADSPDVSKQSGGYYEDRALAVSSRQAQDPALATPALGGQRSAGAPALGRVRQR